MRAARRLYQPNTPLSPEGLIAYAKVISGISTYCPPALAPDVERDILKVFRRVTNRLDYLNGKPAFCREIAREYHELRGSRVLITERIK